MNPTLRERLLLPFGLPLLAAGSVLGCSSSSRPAVENGIPLDATADVVDAPVVGDLDALPGTTSGSDFDTFVPPNGVIYDAGGPCDPNNPIYKSEFLNDQSPIPCTEKGQCSPSYCCYSMICVQE